jgi:hypothetical protein
MSELPKKGRRPLTDEQVIDLKQSLANPKIAGAVSVEIALRNFSNPDAWDPDLYGGEDEYTTKEQCIRDKKVSEALKVPIVQEILRFVAEHSVSRQNEIAEFVARPGAECEPDPWLYVPPEFYMDALDAARAKGFED